MPLKKKGVKTNQKVAKRPKAVQKKIQKHRTGRSQFRAIAPATGRTVSRAFGSGSGDKRHAWNALHPSHLALPRPVGPYTVIRLTTTFSTKDPFVMIGSFSHMNGDRKRPDMNFKFNSDEWSTVCAISCPESHMNKPVGGFQSIPVGDPAKFHFYTMNGLSSSCLRDNSQICPAAITVQVMNQNALQQTKGLVYAAVTPLEANYNNHGGAKTPREIGENMIAFMKPRLLALPKLAMAGVCAHSHPLDMNDISEFREVGSTTSLGNYIKWPDPTDASTLYPWGWPHQPTTSGGVPANDEVVNVQTCGWAPIMFYRPDVDETSDKLTFQVTKEYRVRFDLSNVASATHSMHTPAPMTTYTNMIKQAVAKLPGILENVAENAGGAYAAGRGLMALAA